MFGNGRARSGVIVLPCGELFIILITSALIGVRKEFWQFFLNLICIVVSSFSGSTVPLNNFRCHSSLLAVQQNFISWSVALKSSFSTLLVLKRSSLSGKIFSHVQVLFLDMNVSFYYISYHRCG